MADRKWSELGTPVTPTDTDRVAMQRGSTNPVWSFATLRTYLNAFFYGPSNPAPTATAANVGTGAGTFRDKIADVLNFRRIRSTDSTVTITENANDIDLTVPLTGANVGTGADVFRDKTGNSLNLRTIRSNDASITVTQNADDIDLAADLGETNTASNVGTGAGVFRNKTGANLNLRRIRSSDLSITVSEGADDIDLTTSAGGGIGRGSPFETNFLTIVTDAGVGTEEISTRRGAAGGGATVELENLLAIAYDVQFRRGENAPVEAAIGPKTDGQLGSFFSYYDGSGGGPVQEFQAGGYWALPGQARISGQLSLDDLPYPAGIGASLQIDDAGFVTVGPSIGTTFQDESTSALDIALDFGTGTSSAWIEITQLANTLVNSSSNAVAQFTATVSQVQNTDTICTVEYQVALAGQGASPTGGVITSLKMFADFNNQISVSFDLGSVSAGQEYTVYARLASAATSVTMTQTLQGTVKPSRLTVYELAGGGGGGEVNTSTTPAVVGGNEADINMPKVGPDLQKRKLVGGTSITLSQASDSITISSDAVPNVSTVDGDLIEYNGSGYQRLPLGADAQVLTARPGGGVGNKLVWEDPAAGSGEANVSTTPAAVGGNEADINMAKVGADLQKRKLVGGQAMTLTQGADSITFASDVGVATTDGDLLSFDGTGYNKIAIGLDGQQLTARPAAGAGLKVAWETPASGGDVIQGTGGSTGEVAVWQDFGGKLLHGTGIPSASLLLADQKNTITSAYLQMELVGSDGSGIGLRPQDGTPNGQSFDVGAFADSFRVSRTTDTGTLLTAPFQIDWATSRHTILGELRHVGGYTTDAADRSGTWQVDLTDGNLVNLTGNTTVQAAAAGLEGSITVVVQPACDLTMDTGVVSNVLTDDPGAGTKRLAAIVVVDGVTHFYIGATALD